MTFYPVSGKQPRNFARDRRFSHLVALDHGDEHAMRTGFSRSKERSLRVSKKEEGAGGARETDPLLSASAGRAAESHYHGSIRSRRSSRSPALLRDSLMNPDDRYTADVASADVYSEDVYELHTDSTSSASSQQQQQQAQHTGLQREPRPPQPGDDRQVFHLRRTNAVYSPPTGDNSRSQQPLDGDGEPPLLEIPEEIYAVRKAALQVMKPLIGSWVRALKPLFLLTKLCQRHF